MVLYPLLFYAERLDNEQLSGMFTGFRGINKL